MYYRSLPVVSATAKPGYGQRMMEMLPNLLWAHIGTLPQSIIRNLPERTVVVSPLQE